ncbi:PepSY domain-containing protein [Pseudomonas sp. LS44]|uniref:PepSY-associated TM helix domain-containing protein n=1 Tax=Pseudomonas sp. LS44 TaxID=1357074 RepID=UPI00215AF46C|nr:PepSY domain-containing protein [Pseudomonas sp. LS44]UVE18385.1 PepSY domain-containing protein [Pseudomonas sp. LS44]
MNQPTPSFYQLAWRWHFYAGLFVIPFLIMLSLTGLLYLFKPQLDQLMYPELLQVSPAAQVLDADQLRARVSQAHPQAQLLKYLPPANATASAQFVVNQDGRELNLFVDPYRGTLLGSQDAHDNLQAIARSLHGTLLIGTLGDRLIELAAGWAIVLVVSGLYLWWPRGQGGAGVLWPRLSARGRLLWRDLHAVTGFWGSALLLFMLLTGMTWTGFWGAQFAAVWNQFPAEQFRSVPKSGLATGSLNEAHRQTVAWAAETAPLPVSDPHAVHQGHDMASMAAPDVPVIGLQRVLDIAAAQGVPAGFSVTLPKGPAGVYTVALGAADPSQDVTLHLDQYSGQPLAAVRWAQYGTVARGVSLGIALHEGKLFGLANQLVMAAVCLLVLLSAVSGLVMWWKRRPQGSFGAPPLRHDLPLWKGAVLVMLVLGVAFPLVGGSLLAVWLLDRLWLAMRIAGRPAISD